MPMHISPSIDTDFGRIETMLPRMGPIMNPLSPATQSDILGILQREQDRAMSLLSLSPLLASLFVSYANQVAALESASATPSPESEEWKALQNTIDALQDEIKKLKSENVEVTEGLEGAEASREAFRSQVSSLKEVNATQQDDIKSLRAELAEAKDKYDRLLVDSNAEKAALQVQVLDLETQRAELKETVVEQQIKISKVERQGFSSLSRLPNTAPPIETIHTRRPEILEDRGSASALTRPTALQSDFEYLTDSALGLPPITATPLTPPPIPVPESLYSNTPSSATPELPKMPKGVEDETSATPKPWHAGPSVRHIHPSPPPPPPSVPAETEPEKPLSLWERKKIKAAALPAPQKASWGAWSSTPPKINTDVPPVYGRSPSPKTPPPEPMMEVPPGWGGGNKKKKGRPTVADRQVPPDDQL